jgi:hypothetical protein
MENCKCLNSVTGKTAAGKGLLYIQRDKLAQINIYPLILNMLVS